tara:strand:- start:531 stop:1451 length:921 start_codon:yes stop_codon:yes gene_type:complete
LTKRSPKNQTSIVIVGLVRDCEKTIATQIKIIDSAFIGFKEKDWIIVESDSEDNTLKVLDKLKNEFSINIISKGKLREILPKRTERLASCRNEYIQLLNNNSNYQNKDYVIVVDLDNANKLLKQEAIDYCWESDIKWDACFANQSAPYYDIWALRHKLWSPNDFSKSIKFLQKYNISESHYKKHLIYSKMIRIEPNEEPIEVDSAFGGLGIYKKKLFDQCKYSGLDEENSEICEHISIHESMKNNNARFYIMPKLINDGWNEHSKQLLIINRFKVTIISLIIKFLQIFLSKEKIKLFLKKNNSLFR